MWCGFKVSLVGEWEDIQPYSLTALGMLFGLQKHKRECSVMSPGPKVNTFLESIPAVSNEKYLVPKHIKINARSL